MSTLSATLVLTPRVKASALAQAFLNGGERSLRFMAHAIGAGPCPKCDFVITHCKCPKD